MKSNKKLLIGVIVAILGVLTICACLSVGKCSKVTVSDLEGNNSSYFICKGELVGCAEGLKADRDISEGELLNILGSRVKGQQYFRSNISNKGYSNDQVIKMIKEYLEPQGIEVTVEDHGTCVVGLNWIIHKFSNK